MASQTTVIMPPPTRPDRPSDDDDMIHQALTPMTTSSSSLMIYITNLEKEKSPLYQELSLGEAGAESTGRRPTSVPSGCIDPDLRSRNLSIVALGFAWLVGIAAVAIGTRLVVLGTTPVPGWLVGKMMSMSNNVYPYLALNAPYFEGHRIFTLPEAAAFTLTLVLSIFLTSILDGMNFIPATTMRWSLRREGRLHHNSNLRLFSSVRWFAPNGFFANVVSGVALVLAYGGITVMTHQVYIVGSIAMVNGRPSMSAEVQGERYALDFNGWGFLGLGMGLLLQAMMASWALYNSIREKLVPTWSSNPVGTARACLLLDSMENTDSGFLYPITPSPTNECLSLSRPRRHQKPMIALAPKVKAISYIIWVLFVAISSWTIVIGGLAYRNYTTTETFLASGGSSIDSWAYWQNYGQVFFNYSKDPYTNRRDWAGLLIQCSVLSVITLGIHCVELVVHAARDESTWRRASSVGIDPNQGAFNAGLLNWPTWFLFFAKALVNWIFGFAFSTDCYVFMNLLPLIALSASFFLLAIFTQYLIHHRPRGPQPSTFGNLRALAGLLDDWNHERLFWGDKGKVEGRLRRAGFAGRPLGDLRPYAWYLNLKVDNV